MNTQANPKITAADEMRAKLLSAQSQLVDGINLLELAGEKTHGNPDVAWALLKAVGNFLDQVYNKIDEVANGLPGDSAKGDSNG